MKNIKSTDISIAINSPAKNSIPNETDFKLPAVIRYYDEILDEEFTIRNPMQNDTWCIRFDATVKNINFSEKYSQLYRPMIKYYFGLYLLKGHVSTVVNATQPISNFLNRPGIQNKLFTVDIKYLRTEYDVYRLEITAKSQIHFIRTFIKFLANNEYGKLSKKDSSFIASWPLPKVNRNARIKTGNAILTFEDEFKVAKYLTERAIYWNTIEAYNHVDLLEDSILVLCMCLGLRPKQIAMIKIADLNEYSTDYSYYDIAIQVIKQKKRKIGTVRKALPTKWQSIIIKWWNFKKESTSLHQYNKIPLFVLGDSIRPAEYFSVRTRSVTKKILDEPISVYTFRHTLGQRLANEGHSAAEIATALTQTDTATAQAYVDSSPDTARIISEALGKSDVYKNLPDLFEGRLIIRKDYNESNDANKVEGVVDGTWMPGLGLCNVGISICDKSPLLSCHTCPKFLPLMEVEPHQQLAKQLRVIVERFAKIQIQLDQPSPPLMKLNSSLVSIEQLLVEIGKKTKDSYV